MGVATTQAIQRLEAQLARLQQELVVARNNVQSWVDAGSSLSRSAAEARAKNQGVGRGFAGALLGSKFRAAMRAGVASSNASIAKDVAKKRSEIAAGKATAQEQVKRIQADIAHTKQLIREEKAVVRAKETVASSRSKSVDLLHKLKEAHDLGLLTDAEYEEKRARLVSEI